jgi:glycine cleavage system H lipoate-binding protein
MNEGWLIKMNISNKDELSSLLSEDDYNKIIINLI